MNRCKGENYRHAHHAECYSCVKCPYGNYYYCTALAQMMFLESQYKPVQEHKCACGKILRLEMIQRGEDNERGRI